MADKMSPDVLVEHIVDKLLERLLQDPYVEGVRSVFRKHSQPQLWVIADFGEFEITVVPRTGEDWSAVRT